MTPTFSALTMSLWIAHPLLAAPVQSQASEQELASLQGTWSVVAVTIEGEQLSPAQIGEAFFEVRGDRVISRRGETGRTFRITIDAATDPVAIDLFPIAERTEGEPRPGILRLEKDRWTLCMAHSAGDGSRPTGFAAEAGSGNTLMQLRRVED